MGGTGIGGGWIQLARDGSTFLVVEGVTGSGFLKREGSCAKPFHGEEGEDFAPPEALEK